MVLQMLLSRFPGVLPDEQANAKAAQGARKLGILTADNRYVAELGERELEEIP